jgi:integrase
MKLLKRSARDGAPWYLVFRETLPGGKKKQKWVSTGTPEHAKAKQIAAKILSDSALRAHGIIDPQSELFIREGQRSIEDHLTDFRPRLLSRATGKNKTRNVNGQLNYIRKFAKHAAIVTIGQMNADLMNRYIVHLSDLGKSARTIGAMIGACKHFTSWLKLHGKLRVDPLETVEKPDPESDRRLRRRMLRPTEWQWLIRATMAGPERYDMAAVERSLLYRIAIQTGLRSAELLSLNRGNFELDALSPFVKVASGNTKNRQTAHQYIDAELARDLRIHLATKTPNAPAFNLPHKYAALMLQADVQAARALWLSEAKTEPDERARREASDFLMPTSESGEELDFHALRHTCGAWLATQGVQPKVIQSVMRHSTITLTLDTYGHLIEGAEAAAVNQTAGLLAVPELLKATGTNGTSPGGLANNVLTTAVRDACGPLRAHAAKNAAGTDSKECKNPQNQFEVAGSCDSVHARCDERRARESNPQLLPATDFESAS